MKLLQVIHNFLPQHFGGTELHCYDLSRALASQNEVRVLFCEQVSGVRAQQSTPTQIGGLSCLRVLRDYEKDSFEETYENAAMDRLFSNALDDLNPDVVHIHHLMFHSLNYVQIAKRRGVPVVFTVHDYWLSCPNRGLRLFRSQFVCDQIPPHRCAECVLRHSPTLVSLKRGVGALTTMLTNDAGSLGAVGRATLPRDLDKSFGVAHHRPARWAPPLLLDGSAALATLSPFLALGQARRSSAVRRRLNRVRSVCRAVDVFVAPTRFAADSLRELSVPQSRVVVLPHGAGLSSCGVSDQKAGMRSIRFGYVGSLGPHKGIHVLIDALQQVYQTLSTDVSLKIWGETRWNRRNVDRLRRRIGSLPARICGPFDHDDAKEVYAGIDVLVLPSVWWENSSLAILEAQAMGIPVIATAIGGNSELVLDGHNGLLAQPGSASDLARQMRKIATDSSLRRQLQRASRQQKDMALYAQEMTAIYNRL